ncbi:putative ABC transporter binding protein NosD [subsurface metagenome]
MITVNLSFIAGNNNKSSKYNNDINLDNKNLKISAVSEKIHIINNSGWVAFKNAGNCTGEGTYSDPYVIEDLVIDGGGSGSCIWIENSSVYFRIEKCSVSYSSIGIRLSNVNNSLIITNNCSPHYYGIYLSECNNNTISGNIANNNGFGIYLYDSNNNTISGNTANDNAGNGISVNYLWESVSGNNIIISGNTANNNDNGIYLYNSNYSTISGNTANNNTYIGIFISGNNNIISENNAINNSGWIHSFGIVVGVISNYNNTISGNTASNNVYGICLRGNNNTISENTAINNDYGIFLEEASDNTILRNTANNNNYGICLEEASDNNNITENIINYNNLIGIVLDSCNGNIIYFNCFNNYLNAIDDGSNNHWDNGIKGNYWSDYTGSDADGDGIGDVPYKITGSAGSQDNFPLMKCPFSAQDGGEIPIELIIFISVISGAALVSVVTILLIRHKRKIK